MQRILAFGVFDGLHPGHLAFLKQARQLGDELVVVVTRDDIAEREKGRRPRILARDRVRLVAAVRMVDRVVLGDLPSTYGAVLRRLKPSIIAMGYDQRCDLPEFRARLRSLGLPTTRIIRLKEYQGHRYHSNQLNIVIHTTQRRP